ncbi:hypothetical protein TNCT_503851 [Trichonephila clavata]|uniref:Uncharacterized protein n=1 Tax=Trichonephila clavata TaxID=2740835 RepID=A0A8X6GEN7_TRICU|nr:hypothetical protein TNCT_503851 [Trichonephila clavata]
MFSFGNAQNAVGTLHTGSQSQTQARSLPASITKATVTALRSYHSQELGPTNIARQTRQLQMQAGRTERTLAGIVKCRCQYSGASLSRKN